MLILRRKSGESFVIGEHVSVTILSADPSGTVTLGITAPKDILILRSELQQAASANQDAAQMDSLQLVQQLEKVLEKP